MVADGCHLTRETGDNISAAGFSSFQTGYPFHQLPRPWGCGQAGNCVEGALSHAMLLLNRNRIKKSRSLKGNLGLDFGGKRKKSGMDTPQSGGGDGVGSLKLVSGSRKNLIRLRLWPNPKPDKDRFCDIDLRWVDDTPVMYI
ncbi:hypothetical protein L6452_17855 [Arctium lappa]|uniref:Uncharacterized protein n=1 Tax=Arctium lappa TaxID=4217 RepID=A0ACB9C4K8_ARCLA|nr:hypothetical protein L6452_17855 [Arctium lappa]